MDRALALQIITRLMERANVLESTLSEAGTVPADDRLQSAALALREFAGIIGVILQSESKAAA